MPFVNTNSHLTTKPSNFYIKFQSNSKRFDRQIFFGTKFKGGQNFLFTLGGFYNKREYSLAGPSRRGTSHVPIAPKITPQHLCHNGWVVQCCFDICLAIWLTRDSNMSVFSHFSVPSAQSLWPTNLKYAYFGKLLIPDTIHIQDIIPLIQPFCGQERPKPSPNQVRGYHTH